MKVWLDQLQTDPQEAFESLVMGRADVGVFSRAALGEILVLAARQNASKLDQGVHAFLAKHLLKAVPVPLKPSVWGAYLQDVFNGIASLKLENTRILLRTRHPAFRRWLRGFYVGDSLDPELAFLRALAWAQDNNYFVPLWHRLVVGAEGRGLAYVEAGLLGVRKALDARGNSPEVPTPLLNALIDLAGLPETREVWWARKVRSLQAAYHCGDQVWRGHLQTAVRSKPHSEQVEAWLETLYPAKAKVTIPRSASTRILHAPTRADYEGYCGEIARRGPKGEEQRIAPFLKQHRDYAAATGDASALVMAFNRLASDAMKHDPGWALALVEEALKWQPGNPHNWVVKARCLEAAHQDNKAIETLWEARIRLPQHVYVRTELGRMLREGGDLETSQAVYEEAANDFDHESAVWCGLAEVLSELGKTDEAIEAYRKAVQRATEEKDIRYARTGLANQLMKRRKPDDLREAEEVLRETMRMVPDDLFVPNTLAELLKDQERFEEAAEICRDTAGNHLHDPVSRSILGEILFNQGLKAGGDVNLKEEARQWFQEAADLGDRTAQERLDTLDQRWEYGLARGGQRVESRSVADRDLRRRLLEFETTETAWSPAQRLGRALLAQWQAAREENPKRQALFFDRAERLLSVPDEQIGEEFLTAFIEARGFLLLAQGKTPQAVDYFREQVEHFGRGAWTGIQLGYAEARLRAGQEVSAAEWRALGAAGPEGAVTSLVARVLGWLTKEDDKELRSVLAELYPKATVVEPKDDELRRPDFLLRHFVKDRWFAAAGIEQQADLENPTKLTQFRAAAEASTQAIRQTMQSVQLALAA